MRELSYTDALREVLAAELRRDPKVFLLGEDIAAYGGAFGVTRGLVDEFGPERVMNTPISEGGFTGVAIGAAMMGYRPVVEIMFMDFMGLVSDQLLNMAAKLHYIFGAQAKCPLVLRTPGGGGRCYGPTHSQSLEAWFFHVPGIKIAAPATPADAQGLLRSAIRDDNPVLFLEHKLLYGLRGLVADAGEPALPFGQARQVATGNDITIIAWSWMSHEAERAAASLADQGVQADVLDLRTLAPLDWEAVYASVRKTGRVLIVEEANRTGGVAAEIGCRIAEEACDYLQAPVRRLAEPDVPIPASPKLERAMIPDAAAIVTAALDLVSR